jgi:hypothetical protein
MNSWEFLLIAASCPLASYTIRTPNNQNKHDALLVVVLVSQQVGRRHLIRAWRGAGERENRSSKKQRVRKIVDPLNLDRDARVQ